MIWIVNDMTFNVFFDDSTRSWVALHTHSTGSGTQAEDLNDLYNSILEYSDLWLDGYMHTNQKQANKRKK